MTIERPDIIGLNYATLRFNFVVKQKMSQPVRTFTKLSFLTKIIRMRCAQPAFLQKYLFVDRPTMYFQYVSNIGPTLGIAILVLVNIRGHVTLQYLPILFSIFYQS